MVYWWLQRLSSNHILIVALELSVIPKKACSFDVPELLLGHFIIKKATWMLLFTNYCVFVCKQERIHASCDKQIPGVN